MGLNILLYKQLYDIAYDLSSKIPLIITGGVAANHYIKERYRRISSDIDLLILQDSINKIKNVNIEWDRIFNQSFYYIKLSNLFIYLIPISSIYFYYLMANSKYEKIRSFLDYFGERLDYYFYILDKKSIIYFKSFYLSNPERKGEIIKDIYDIPLIGEDVSFLSENIKEKVISSLKAGYYLIDDFKRKITNKIVSREFPEDWIIYVGSIQGRIDPMYFLYVSLIVGLRNKDIKRISKKFELDKKFSGYIAYSLLPVIKKIENKEYYIDLIKERGREGLEKLIERILSMNNLNNIIRA